MMKHDVSIAIETSCRIGGLALGAGGRCIEAVSFDAASRHATVLVAQMKALLDASGLGPHDLSEVYVSAGPGSFTSLRVGITAVRTLAQALPHIRCVAVPTARAVAQNAAEMDWRYLGVVLGAKAGSVHATVFRRRDGRIVQAEPGRVWQAEDFLAAAPRPITLIGEALAYQPMAAPGVTAAPPEAAGLHLPVPRAVWHVGYEMARAGQFTEYHHLLPIYARRPEAVRLWEQRSGRGKGDPTDPKGLGTLPGDTGTGRIPARKRPERT